MKLSFLIIVALPLSLHAMDLKQKASLRKESEEGTRIIANNIANQIASTLIECAKKNNIPTNSLILNEKENLPITLQTGLLLLIQKKHPYFTLITPWGAKSHGVTSNIKLEEDKIDNFNGQMRNTLFNLISTKQSYSLRLKAEEFEEYTIFGLKHK